MRKASAEWLQSAEMDLDSIVQIIHDFAKSIYEQVKGKLAGSP